MSRKFGIGVLLVTLALAGAQASDDISYNYVQIGYIDAEIDGGPSGDGFGIDGSFELHENYHLFAGYGDLTFSEFGIDVDLSSWTVGAGYDRNLTDASSLYFRVGYVDAEIDTPIGTASDDGFSAGLGLRGMVLARLELAGEITYVDLSDAGDDTSFSFGALYSFTPNVAAGVGFTASDDVDELNIGVRFYWGR